MTTTDSLTYFAYNPVLGQIGIAKPDRRYHFYIIGRTGTGKTTLLLNKIAQDLAAGCGLALIDPHGDLAEEVLLFVPPKRQKDLVYFNPSDLDHPIGFNVLECLEPASTRHLLAEGLLSIFRKMWTDFWGPRMSYLLHNAILALLENSGSTLLALARLLSDSHFRTRIIRQVRDPLVRHYWEKEFASFPERLLPEIVSPVQNKIGAYLANRPLRNILGQTKSTINLDHIMSNSGILIVNLAKGRLGEEAANLLGSLLVTKFQLQAMARASLPEEERPDFYFYIDEFHNFTTESFADLLAEARKYRLSLILVHQYLEQLSEQVRSALLANVGTMVVFRVGPEDAQLLAKEFEPYYSWGDLVNLSAHEVYYKMLSSSQVSRPYPAITLPPPKPPQSDPESYKQKLIDISRQRYGRPRQQIEQKINRFFH